MKATKEQFEAYKVVRASGSINMFDVDGVIILAKDKSNVKINREQCLDIMYNFADYQKEYDE